MSDHSWVFEVLDDLGRYAMQNNMENLGYVVKEAQLAASTDITIAKLKQNAILTLRVKQVGRTD